MPYERIRRSCPSGPLGLRPREAEGSESRKPRVGGRRQKPRVGSRESEAEDRSRESEVESRRSRESETETKYTLSSIKEYSL